MDLDRDGRLDLVSGSYLPGDVFWFPRTVEGGLGAARRIELASGAPLRVGRASWPFVVDWEGDGDLDLVLGNMLGAVFLARNASGGPALALAEPEPLALAGEPLKLLATNAAPCVADWDGDGAPDLLLGAGDGAVRLYRNASRSGEPALAPARELVPPSPAGPPPAQPTRNGPRARVAVADWNADGRLDLLVGEHVSEDGPPVTLDAAGERALEEARDASAALGRERGERERAAFTRWLAEQRIPASEASARYDDFLVEWEAGAEGQALVRRQAELADVLARLQAPILEHGRVWVYLRRGS